MIVLTDPPTTPTAHPCPRIGGGGGGDLEARLREFERNLF